MEPCALDGSVGSAVETLDVLIYAYAIPEWTIDIDGHMGFCKGCKGKRGPPEPSCSNPKKLSSSRQKRVFLRFDPIDKNGGFSLYTLYKIPMHMHAAMGRYAYGVI